MLARNRLRLTLVLLAADLTFTLASPAQIDNRAQQILALTNEDRAEHGLHPLQWDQALAAAAMTHDDRMANEKTLSHQYPGEPDVSARAAQAGAHFQAIAENTAMGPSPKAIEKQWMTSVPHRSNILDPKMNAIGIAVVERGGYLFATEDLADAAQSLSIPLVEDKVGALLRDQNIDPTGPRPIAEQACSSDRGMPTGTNARAVIRFQTSDLSQLPSQIAQQLKSGEYTKAAVGACAPGRNAGNFTSYRVAVLLF